MVSLKGGRVTSTEIWLTVIHKAKLVYTAPFLELWHMVAAIDYNGVNVTDFNEWFATWYEKQDAQLLPPRQLLFPT